MPCNEISPIQLVIVAAVLSLALGDDRDPQDLNVLGALITSIGDLVSLIAAQKEKNQSIQEKEATRENIMKQIKELQLQCEKLK